MRHPRTDFGLDVQETLNAWRRGGWRLHQLKPNEAALVKRYGGIDVQGLPHGQEEAFFRRYREHVLKMAAEHGEKIPDRVLDAIPGIREEINQRKMTMMKAKNQRSQNQVAARAGRDMFGGGRIKPGDVLTRTWKGKTIVARINKASISYSVDGEDKGRVSHLGDIVRIEFPRSEYYHHFSGWGFFKLKPKQIEARQRREEKLVQKMAANKKAVKVAKKKTKAAKRETKAAKKKTASVKRGTTKKTSKDRRRVRGSTSTPRSPQRKRKAVKA